MCVYVFETNQHLYLFFFFFFPQQILVSIFIFYEKPYRRECKVHQHIRRVTDILFDKLDLVNVCTVLVYKRNLQDIDSYIRQVHSAPGYIQFRPDIPPANSLVQ